MDVDFAFEILQRANQIMRRNAMQQKNITRILMIVLVLTSIMLGGCWLEEPKVVLINLGDSYANGVQSGGGNVNQYTQVNSYPQVLADQMREVIALRWNNPLVDMHKQRINGYCLPYNVGVDGATIQSLLQETSDDSEYINELMKPIPAIIRRPVTQLEAAEFVAGLYPDDTIKIITLFIGGNDILGTVNAGGGTQLTVPQINAFLNDSAAGHDLDSVTANLTTIVDRLAAIPNGHVFISNLPSVTAIAGLFSNEDIAHLAVYTNPTVNAMAEEEFMGFVPVGGFGMLPGLGGALAANDPTLNGTITAILAGGGNDAFSLTADETSIIVKRTEAINAHIAFLSDHRQNVYLVDMVTFFDDVFSGNVIIGGVPIERRYGGGLFSLDGFHPSNTGYALIADVFIDSINTSGLLPEIPNADLETFWATEPYRDNDGDGYVAGPADLSIIDPTFISFLDCNDDDPAIFAPFPTDGMAGSCP